MKNSKDDGSGKNPDGQEAEKDVLAKNPDGQEAEKDVLAKNPDGQEAEDDIFNLNRLRLTQNFADGISVKKVITTVPVRKPDHQDWNWVRKEEEYRFQTCVLNLKKDREVFLVDRELWPELSREIVPTTLFTCITREGVLFLWPIRLPSRDGRHDHWNRSALEAAGMAEEGWIRIVSNTSLGAYEVFKANGEFPRPEWPELSFGEIIKIAFKDNFIRDLDHIVIRRLRGQV
jgi:hypothetical protein